MILPLLTSTNMADSSLTTLMVTQKTASISSAIPNTTLYADTFTNSTMSSNLTEEERRRYLDMLQEDTTRKLIPAVVFLAIVAVVGLLGNSMVLLVYSKKARRNATDIFIMAIAVFDLFTNVLGTPVEIYELLHGWNFDNVALCKFRAYFNGFTCWTAAVVLLAVAYTRYRKICRPFGKQTSRRSAKITTIVITLFCSIIASPYFILCGIRTRFIETLGIFGKQCSISDNYANTYWPKVFYAGILLLLLSVSIPLIVLYILIGLQAWRHSGAYNSGAYGIPSTPITPAAPDHTKSNAWNCWRRKKKHDVTPKDSGNYDDNVNEESDEIERDPMGRQRKKDETKSVDDATTFCTGTKKMVSPTKDKSHVNISMTRDLSARLNKVRDSKIHTDEDDDTNDTAEKSKSEVSTEISPLSKCPSDIDKTHLSKEDTENCQNEIVDTKQMRKFTSNIQWVDIPYCINEEAKTEDQDADSDQCISGKENSQSARTSLQNQSLQKLSDRLTRVKKAKRESLVLKKIGEPPTATATILTNGFCGNNLITKHETNIKSNDTKERRREFKNCKSTSQNSPWNSTSKIGYARRQSNARRRALTRTTLMLIIISAIFLIALVPHAVVVSLKYSMAQTFLTNMNDVEFTTYHIFQRLFFVNSAANAIIYSLCDIQFRDQMQKIIKCRN